ncbi:cold shock domain-containing protein [Paenibacillus lautus]|uniref:cold-shock protein n=1 Tax=Paenibacillus lautus TaxID=1401 RepID=UPI003D2BE1D1
MKSFIGELKSFIQTKAWSGGAGTGDEIETIGPSLGKSTREISLQKAASNLGKDIGKAVVTGIMEAETNPKRLTGTVVLYRDHRGFGFIKQAKGKDIFFHIRDVADPGLTHFEQGERVSYELGEKDGRQAAVKIALV